MFKFVKKSTHDAVVAERDALRAKLERYTKGLAQGAAASAAKRRNDRVMTERDRIVRAQVDELNSRLPA